MAGENPTPIEPVIVAPVVAPTVETVAPVAAPVVEVVPVVEAAPTPVVAEPLPTERLTLLEQFDKDAAAKPEVVVEGEKPAVEAKEGEKPAVEAKVEEAKPAEVQPKPVEPEPIKFEYKLPEGVVLPEAQQTELNEAFTNFARNPGSAEAQQKLVDFHQARLTEVADAATRFQHQTFSDVRDRWQNEIKNHPTLGGGNLAPALQAVAHVRDNFVSLEPRGSKAYDAAMARFNEFTHYTGAGDHPAFLELMHNISTVLNEASSDVTPDVKLIQQQENNGRAPIYRHPTSLRNGR